MKSLEWTVEDGPAAVTADPDGAPTPDSWPMAGYDPAGTAAAPAENAPDEFPLERTWSESTGDNLPTTPAVAGGTLLVSTTHEDSALFAYDPADGTERWSTTSGRVGGVAPAIAGDTAFVSRNEEESGEYLDAVALSDGERRWRRALPSSMPVPPVVAEDTVFTGHGLDATVLAVDAESGDLGVRLALSEPSTGIRCVAVANGRAYVGAAGSNTDYDNLGWLFALDPTAGAVEWVYPAGAPVADLAVRDGTVYLTDGNEVSALDADDGEVEWTARDDVDLGRDGRLAVTEDAVLVGESERTLGLDASSGETTWTAPVGGSDVLACAGETVFAAGPVRDSDSWALVAFAVDDGRERLWQDLAARPTGGTVADGAVFLVTEFGTVHRFGAGDESGSVPESR